MTDDTKPDIDDRRHALITLNAAMGHLEDSLKTSDFTNMQISKATDLVTEALCDLNKDELDKIDTKICKPYPYAQKKRKTFFEQYPPIKK